MNEKTIYLTGIPRDANGVPCECKGFAGVSDDPATPQELKDYGCGRSYKCCTAVFRCIQCGARVVAALDSPEMEY